MSPRQACGRGITRTPLRFSAGAVCAHSEEIAKHLPKERRAFNEADSIWRSIMAQVQKTPDVELVTEQERLLDDLKQMNSSFTVIEKSLNAYLDSKKLAFPRFFFLSNEELIEILSETKDPLNVQPFVKKCFEAVAELDFDSDLQIRGMKSLEGEEVSFIKGVDPTGETNGVERWLLQVEDTSMKTLHSITEDSVRDYEAKDREKWILDWPGQVVIAVSQVCGTSCHHACLNALP